MNKKNATTINKLTKKSDNERKVKSTRPKPIQSIKKTQCEG
jgi:hypothetical protein